MDTRDLNYSQETDQLEECCSSSEQMRHALLWLHDQGDIVELRVLNTTEGTISGYFDGADDYTSLYEAAVAQNGHSNVYITLNPVKQELLDRSKNHTTSNARQTTKDADISHYRWLFIDIDPAREDNVSSTEAEHDAALRLADKIVEDMKNRDWPDPIIADSGNGAHVLWYIDLVNTPENKELVRNALTWFDQQYTSPVVSIDTSVFNPARLIKLYGTMACKGPDTTDRPHRISKILSCPEGEIKGVESSYLHGLANSLLKKKTKKSKSKSRGESDSPADELMEICNSITFFKDDDETTYASVPVKGHEEVCKVCGELFKKWLRNEYRRRTGKPVTDHFIDTVVATQDAKTKFEDVVSNPKMRIASSDDKIHYHLADTDWRTVEISSTDYRIINTPAHRFIKAQHALPQCTPTFPGDFNLVNKHISFDSHNDELLFNVVLITYLIPDIPHPVLILYGEKGSAKSTTTRMIKSLVDPSKSELLTFPTREDDMPIQFTNNYLLAYDNLDRLTAQQSDRLCTAVTGGAISKRALYTDDGEFLMTYQNCIVLNGINVAAHRPDLLERSLLIKLKSIRGLRKDEVTLKEAFNRDKPAILGGMLRVLSSSMKIYPTVSLTTLPRMADFAKWGYAIAEAMGGRGNEFMEAYEENLECGNLTALESSPLASVLIEFMSNKQSVTASVASLYKSLKDLAWQMKIPTHNGFWPGAPNHMSRKLAEIEPSLKDIGIEVTRLNTGLHKEITIINTRFNRRTAASRSKRQILNLDLLLGNKEPDEVTE